MKQAKPKPEELRTMSQIMQAWLFGMPFTQACSELFNCELHASLPEDQFQARCVVNFKQLISQSLALKEDFVKSMLANHAGVGFTADDFVVTCPTARNHELCVGIDSLDKYDVCLKIERVVVSSIASSYRCVVENGINTTIINGKLFSTVMQRAVSFFIAEAAKCVLRESCDLQDAITLCKYALRSKKLTKAQKAKLRLLSTEIDNVFPSTDKGVDQ